MDGGISAGQPEEGGAIFSYSTIGYGEPESRMGPNGGRGTWYNDRGWPRRSCVRTAKFRLDKNMKIDGKKAESKDEDIFLADVVKDPNEIIILAGNPKYADEVRRLSRLLDKHAEGAVEVPPDCVRRNKPAKKSTPESDT